ncbi:MAG: hypothetical protein EXX96DRAFT_586924 [Benjaminiella poitrasii]|nr:MAG: hypothetical protein EXX96DRAFT_586924 [Benjaminiella poitrasii]
MVDVVGFSTLTTMAQAKGDSGAEAIAMEIGAYMGECIQIIEFYGGDVVKFLGDAVLVCFQPLLNNESDSSTEPSDRQKNVLVRRGIECGLQLLARLSHYRVYLTAEERSKHRTHQHSASSAPPQPDQQPTTHNNNFLSALFNNYRKRNANRRTSDASEISMIETTNCVDLELHMALACGNVTNIIVGDMDTLDQHSTLDGMEYHGRLEYAIGGQVVDALDEALSLAKAGEMSITPAAYEIMKRQIHLNFEQRRKYFVIKNFIKPSHHGEYHHLRALPGLRREYSRADHQQPLVPRTRNVYGDLPFEANQFYYKYINRSALYRMQRSSDDNLPAQFREVTIMFVSLGKTNVEDAEGVANVQKAVMIVIQILIKYEGMLQQFAIDDKGATLLSVFGLPPLSHEREAVFAAKAALEIRDCYHYQGFTGFSISLSTGIIFTAVVPQNNPFRRDPGISGDTIVIAVRMLKYAFSKESVVCDVATRKQIGGLCEFEDFGEHFMKGKPSPVQVFGIVKFNTSNGADYKRISNGKLTTDFIGYKSEMQTATHFVNDWSKAPNHHFLVVTGPSGVGKSFFCNNLHKIVVSHGVTSCWTSSTEVEKCSKYYLLRNIMLAMFEIIDSDRIPQKTGRSQPNSPQSSSFESDLSSSSSGGQSSSRFKRLTSYTAVSSSNSDMVDLILRCLQKCGEESGYVPLFKVIFASLGEVSENRYTRLLDGRARDILLTGVITRMVMHVSRHAGLVFICDDVQWADSASIKMLEHIQEHCQKVMMLMATRPIKDYDVGFIEQFKKTGSYVEIPLNGLGEYEIGEIILQNFGSGVKTISPEIVKVIQKRTGGNPLYVKNMAIILKDFNHVTVVEGELVPSSNSFDLEDLLGNFDYKRIIKMQFDRLDSNYQEFLTIACCLDQYFTVFEVQAVIKPTNIIFQSTDTTQIQRLITYFDAYHFLQQVDETLYTFTHVTIPQSIYDMISYETRLSQHLALARYYESQSQQQTHELLGKITRHYLETDAVDKQLYYLERLADQNMQTYLLPEATINLQRIVKILDEHPHKLAQFGSTCLSDIYRKLGMCFTMRTKLTEGEHYLFRALEVLGEPWPQAEVLFWMQLWKHRFRQYRHRRHLFRYRASKHGERVVEIMAQLSNIYFYTGNGRDFVYSCLVGLNECEGLGQTGLNYTLFLARNSLLCWLNDEKEKSIFYIAEALRQKTTDPGTLTICSLLCFAAGKFSNARDLLYQSVDGSRTLGVVTNCQAFYRAVGLLVTMRIFEGTFVGAATEVGLLKQMADTAHSNGDFEAEVWLGVYNVGNAIVIDRMADCAPYVALLEAHVKEAADYNRIAIHGTLVCYYARNHMFDLARRHIQRLVTHLPALTVTPNIFPIYGLIFATMGLYCMVEEGQIELTETKYEKLVFGLSRLNHAFQQVKFWEFTQPCLYLARALPYIMTGRIVEGYMVLRHGVFEMHFIQEIRFLKAYYWANLGKFAFTPEDRVEWTERAKRDFEWLGIPADTYCNPDPGRLYYRNFPADLCREEGTLATRRSGSLAQATNRS